MKLVYKASGIEVRVGDERITDDGEELKVVFFQKPHKPSSQGKVTVEDWEGFQMEYYVSVIGAEWIDREDR